jgi:hypothetical protein
VSDTAQRHKTPPYERDNMTGQHEITAFTFGENIFEPVYHAIGGPNHGETAGAQGPVDARSDSLSDLRPITVGGFVLERADAFPAEETISSQAFPAYERRPHFLGGGCFNPPSEWETTRRALNRRRLNLSDPANRGFAGLSDEILESTLGWRLALEKCGSAVARDRYRSPPHTFQSSDGRSEVWGGFSSRFKHQTKTRSPFDTVLSMGWKGFLNLAMVAVTPVVAPALLLKQCGNATADVVCDHMYGEGTSEAIRDAKASQKAEPIRRVRSKARRLATQARLAQWRDRYADEYHGVEELPASIEGDYHGSGWSTEREIAIVSDVVTTLGTLLPYSDKYVVEAQRRIRDYYRSHAYWKLCPEDLITKLTNRGVNFLRPVWLDTMARQQRALNHQAVFDYTEMWRERRQGRITLGMWFAAWRQGDAGFWDFLKSNRTGQLAVE